MKRLFIIMISACAFASICEGQGNTNLGTGTSTAGTYNSTFGYYAGAGTLSTTNYASLFGAYAGFSNTANETAAFGVYSLYQNTTGLRNTAFGNNSLYTNTTGADNVAIGNYALNATNSSNNTAVGYGALQLTTVANSTAFGHRALASLQTGSGNVGFGHQALFANITGSNNTSFGHVAAANTTTSCNTAIGYGAMNLNTSGANNTANGLQALYSNLTGSQNTADGYQALYYATGSQNTALGYGSGPTAASPALTNTTSIGYGAAPMSSNQVWLGNSATVTVFTALAFNTSDGRFKKNIREDIVGLDFISKLRPVSYNLQLEQLDHFRGLPDSLILHDQLSKMTAERKTGLIAQEVFQAVSDSHAPFFGVTVPQTRFDTYGLNYNELTVPLVKSVQELAVINEKAKAQTADIDSLLNVLETLALSSAQWDLLIGTGIRAGQLQVSGSIASSTAQAKLLIYDKVGSIVKTVALHERQKFSRSISSEDLTKGTYYCTIIQDGNAMEIKQIEITR